MVGDPLHSVMGDLPLAELNDSSMTRRDRSALSGDRADVSSRDAGATPARRFVDTSARVHGQHQYAQLQYAQLPYVMRPSWSVR
jgi:hypothetical protein